MPPSLLRACARAVLTDANALHEDATPRAQDGPVLSARTRDEIALLGQDPAAVCAALCARPAAGWPWILLRHIPTRHLAFHLFFDPLRVPCTAAVDMDEARKARAITPGLARHLFPLGPCLLDLWRAAQAHPHDPSPVVWISPKGGDVAITVGLAQMPSLDAIRTRALATIAHWQNGQRAPTRHQCIQARRQLAWEACL